MKMSHKSDELKKKIKKGGVHKSGTYGFCYCSVIIDIIRPVEHNLKN